MAKILMKNEEPVLHNGEEVFVSYLPEGNYIKSVDMKKRQLTIVGTTEAKDRDGDIIMMKGWELDNFLSNPVFLWAHDYGGVPIGGAIKVIKKRNPSRMVFVEEFWPEGLYPFSDLIINGYDLRLINASSVGFIPKKREPIEEKEDTDRPWRGTRFLKQELLELSGCAVPCNPTALQELFGQKTFEGKSLEYWSKALNGESVLRPRNKDDIMEEVEKLKKRVEFIDEDAKTQVVVDGLKDDGENKDTETDDEVFETVRSKSDEQEIDTEQTDDTGQIQEEQLDVAAYKDEDPDTQTLFVSIAGDLENFEPPSVTTYDVSDMEFKYVCVEMDYDKKVGGAKNLPLADIDTAWSSGQAIKRIRKWASSDDSGDADKISWAKYKKAFGYYDFENTDKFGSYKLPFADVVDGELKAVFKACAAVVAALNGARGGVDIPDEDRKGVYNLMKIYYKKFDKPIPDLRLFYDLVKTFETTFELIESTSSAKAQEDKSVYQEIFEPSRKVAGRKGSVELDQAIEKLKQVTKELKNGRK